MILDSLNDVVFALDESGVFTYISPAIEFMSRYKVEEVVGKPFVDFVHPDDLPGLMESYLGTLEGSLEPYEFRVRDKDGVTHLVRTSSRPILRDGEPRGLAGVMTDVTASRAAEEEARMLKTICENANFGIAVAGLGGEIIFVNRYFALSHGYLPEEVLGKNLSIFHNRDQISEVDEINRRLKEEGRYDALEVWHARRDGTVFPMLMNGIVIKGLDGKPRYMAATGIDITQRKEWETALMESEERYRDLFDNAGDLIQSVDPEGRFQYVNRTWLETLGYEREELEGLNLFDVVHPRYRAHCREMLKRVLEGEEVEVTEVVYLARDGREVILEGKSSCRFEHGRPVSTRGIFRDITRRRMAEEELKRYREHLEELVEERTLEIMDANERLREEIAVRERMQQELKHKNEELEAFAQAVSHDLRGSLGLIDGFARSALQSLRQGDRAEAEECLACVVEAAERMESHMSSLLAYARAAWREREAAEAGSEEVLREALLDKDPEIRGTGAQVEARGPFPLVKADPVKLYQVFSNLLGNALKYRDLGRTPRLEVACEERGGMAVFQVIDNGIGIPREEHENIFRPFMRCCDSEYPGLGIGLATVKRAVEAWGGEVWVESEPGHGSAFYFTVPLA
ncbi:MAG: PAS domain S-box protein [Actinobacteria bacterium]|nr:PAS domain S-box protein [Actinomycetota bacterium]